MSHVSKKQRTPRLRVVFGRIVTAAMPIAILGCGEPSPGTTPAVDGGAFDAGHILDAGSMDAGPSDAGQLDAGAPDAGPPDAGTPDAGQPDAGPPCETGWTSPLPDPLPDGGIQTACEQVCGGEPLVWHCSVDYTQNPPVLCLGCAAVGRRPAGLKTRHSHSRSRMGALLAEAAALEASSVPAFKTLARELRHHGAPERLVSAARRSAREEQRHTRAMTSLAHRFGGVVPETSVTPQPERSLEEIARENAVEGCVRETWGALCATWQARNAKDPVVRQRLQRIAGDETRHAELSWSVARWAEPRLTTAARSRIESARRSEMKRLRTTADATSAEEQDVLGLPPPAVAQELLRGMAVALGIEG